MVRTKNLSAASGRKQRIEGIVKNLSAKALAEPNSPDENPTEPISVLGVRERSMDSITNRGSPFETGKRLQLLQKRSSIVHMGCNFG